MAEITRLSGTLTDVIGITRWLGPDEPRSSGAVHTIARSCSWMHDKRRVHYQCMIRPIGISVPKAVELVRSGP